MSEAKKSAEVDLFSPGDTTVKRSRYTLTGDRISALSGGIVSRAHDVAGSTLLVHTSIPGRNEQAIDLGAVATAVIHGAVPLASLMLAFKREGKLDEVTAALAAVMPIAASPAAKKA